MINGSEQYATPGAFRRALTDRLRMAARSQGRPVHQLRREFLFQRFLALVFAEPNDHWLLKGGASLLMRLDRARFSRDLDLLRDGEPHAEQAIAELRALTAPQDGDHLTFVVEDGVTYSTVNPVVEIRVTAYIGAQYDTFSIDLARDLHMVAVPERITPNPIVEIPGLANPPTVTLYPLSDQLADKICAMYERHGDSRRASSRFRDLTDLALIISSCHLDATSIHRALRSDEHRRRMRLPETIQIPGPLWRTGYNAYARKNRVDPEFQDVDATLALVGSCLDPILIGNRTTGSWRHGQGWT